MITKTEKIGGILKGLNEVGGISGSLVASRDGLVIASGTSEIDAETFAAMTAAMQGAAETAASELKQGEIEQIVVDAEKGKILSTGAGEKALLVSITKKDINLGLALLEMGKAAEKISNILK